VQKKDSIAAQEPMVNNKKESKSEIRLCACFAFFYSKNVKRRI